MKRSILLLFFGTLLGIMAWHHYQRGENPPTDQRMGEVADKARETAAGAKEAVGEKAEEWKLTPENIREELKMTGHIVRAKARVVGEHIDDARIIAVIKGRYVMDKKLSVLAISVACRDGRVTLTGSATSEELIGRAVNLALQTSGVLNVESLLVVKN